MPSKRLTVRTVERRAVSTSAVSLDPAVAARAAGLVYVRDDAPGIHRVRRGNGFVYRHPDGSTVKDRLSLARIRALAIPPAWSSVWICTLPEGHLQATGRDARGRKQYLYHAAWREIRDGTKFHRLPKFAAALTNIRRRVDRALKMPGLPREKVLATVIRLLDVANLRVGNAEYANANGSFGLTTLRNRHVQVAGQRLKLSFRGKSGVRHEAVVRDERLTRIVKRCSELPGQLLFQYLNGHGEPQPITSSDVNRQLQEWTGTDFTAKDFRTWAGSVAFLRIATEVNGDKLSLAGAVEAVARHLGNTPAICRKHYIHPALLERYAGGGLAEWVQRSSVFTRKRGTRWLDRTEHLLLAFLRSRPAGNVET